MPFSNRLLFQLLSASTFASFIFIIAIVFTPKTITVSRCPPGTGEITVAGDSSRRICLDLTDVITLPNVDATIMSPAIVVVSCLAIQIFLITICLAIWMIWIFFFDRDEASTVRTVLDEENVSKKA